MKTKYRVMIMILMLLIMVGLIVFQADKRVDIAVNGLEYLKAGANI